MSIFIGDVLGIVIGSVSGVLVLVAVIAIYVVYKKRQRRKSWNFDLYEIDPTSQPKSAPISRYLSQKLLISFKLKRDKQFRKLILIAFTNTNDGRNASQHTCNLFGVIIIFFLVHCISIIKKWLQSSQSRENVNIIATEIFFGQLLGLQNNILKAYQNLSSATS